MRHQFRIEVIDTEDGTIICKKNLSLRNRTYNEAYNVAMKEANYLGSVYVGKANIITL